MALRSLKRQSVRRKTSPFRLRIHPPLLLLLLTLIVSLHTTLWWVFPWRRQTEVAASLHAPYAPSSQTECATWTTTPNSNSTTTTSAPPPESIGIAFREHIRTSLHKGHLHYFHLLEFVVVAWIEVQTYAASTNHAAGVVEVSWIQVPHMSYEQAFGPDMNRLLLRMVFGANVQFYSNDESPPPPPSDTTSTTTSSTRILLSIERSRCTDATVKKMWWRHMHRFASHVWYNNLQQHASTVIPGATVSRSNDDKSNPIRIAYIDRQNTRRRFPVFLHWWLLRYLGRHLPSHCSSVEFTHLHMEDLSAIDQVQAASQIDILVGLHGNGLSHQFFMAPGGAVVEVFWEFPFAFDYATSALLLMHHSYLGVWNGHVLEENRIRRLDPTLRTQYASGRVYEWYETEWTSRRVTERVKATKRAIQRFVVQEIERIERERGTVSIALD